MTDTVAAEDAVIETPEAEAAPDAEAKAVRLGWRPKDEFKGDPDKWVDAAEFIRRGEEEPALAKANYAKLEKALERANGKIASLESTHQKLVEHLSTAEKRSYERAKREIEARLDQAAEAGDVEGVRAATRDITDLAREAAAPKVEAPKGANLPPEFEEWEEANPWWKTDTVMTAAAVAVANELEAGGMKDGPKLYAEVTRRIRAEFPHKFENPRRREPAAVEGATNAPKKTGKTYADLPADAKAMCDDFCKNIKGFTREKFVRDYQWS